MDRDELIRQAKSGLMDDLKKELVDDIKKEIKLDSEAVRKRKKIRTESIWFVFITILVTVVIVLASFIPFWAVWLINSIEIATIKGNVAYSIAALISAIIAMVALGNFYFECAFKQYNRLFGNKPNY